MKDNKGLSKRVFRSGAVLALANGVARALAMLCYLQLSRWLAPATFGIYSLVSSLVGIGTTIGLQGLDLAYSRYIRNPRDKRYRYEEAFLLKRATKSAILSGAIFAFIWILLTDIRGQHGDITIEMLYIALTITISVLATMIAARARTQQCYSKISIAMIAGAAVGALLSLSVAFAGYRGVLPLIVGGLATWAVMLILMIPFPARALGVETISVEPNRQNEMIRFGFSSSVVSTVYLLVSSSDRWFLAFNRNSADLGVYAVASTVALAGLMINAAIGLTLYPEAGHFVSNQEGDFSVGLARLCEQLIALLLVVMLLVGSVGRPVLRILTAESFHRGTTYIPWLACGAFFYGMANVGYLPFFLERKMDKVAIIWVIASVASLLLNVNLVAVHGGIGAAISQMLTYLIVCTITIVEGRRVMRLPIRWFKVMVSTLIAIGGLVALVSLDVSNSCIEIAVDLVIDLAIGCIITSLLATEQYTLFNKDQFLL